MQPSRARWAYYPLGFLIGGAIVYTAAPKGDSQNDCSIYEPCSEREEFYRRSSFIIGGVIGMIFGGALATNKVDRFEAIDIIRQERGTRR